MSFDLAICNGIIVSSHNCYKPIIGSIGIRDGFIEAVGEKTIHQTETKEWIDATGSIVMPGLINGHCHGDMTLAKGLGDDLTLKEQNDLFNPINWFFDCMTSEDLFLSRQLTYIEALLSGTTFILENAFYGLGEKAYEAFSSTGIKGGVVEDVVEDFKNPERKRTSDQIAGFKKDCLDRGLLPVLGGLLEEYYHDDFLNYQKTMLEKAGCLWTSHLSETIWRKQILLNRFNASSVQILNKFGMLNEKYIGSHCVYPSAEDIQLLRQHDSKIVNTPLCEMKIADGIAPISDLLANGITVGLGTDGAMWNNSNDLFREMKGLALLHTVTRGIRTLKTTDILDMGTINGAKVFGLENEMGSLQVGKKADIILIDARQPHMAPLRVNHSQNVASTLVFCATGQDVSHVIIDGKLVVENRRLLTMDVSNVMEKAKNSSEKIGKYFEEVMSKRA